MSEVIDKQSARNYVSEWLTANQKQLNLRQLKLEIVEKPAKKMSAQFETTAYLIDIAVWDNAFCLDILILEKSTNELCFSEAGSCLNNSGLLERLNAFSHWVSSHAPVNT